MGSKSVFLCFVMMSIEGRLTCNQRLHSISPPDDVQVDERGVNGLFWTRGIGLSIKYPAVANTASIVYRQNKFSDISNIKYSYRSFSIRGAGGVLAATLRFLLPKKPMSVITHPNGGAAFRTTCFWQPIRTAD